MKAIEINLDIEKDLLTSLCEIKKEHLKNICKIRKKEITCKYILRLNGKFYCAKNSKIQTPLDNLTKEKKMTAQADNCVGLK